MSVWQCTGVPCPWLPVSTRLQVRALKSARPALRPLQAGLAWRRDSPSFTSPFPPPGLHHLLQLEEVVSGAQAPWGELRAKHVLQRALATMPESGPLGSGGPPVIIAHTASVSGRPTPPPPTLKALGSLLQLPKIGH